MYSSGRAWCGDPLSRRVFRFGTFFAQGALNIMVMRSPTNRFVLTIIVFCCWIWGLPAAAQRFDPHIPSTPISPFILDTVEIVTAEVFDSTSNIPLVGALVGDLINLLHIRTKERAVRNELFFSPGDTLRQLDLDELEQNLRRLTIFSEIEFTVVPLEGEEEEEIPYAVLLIRTRDAWSLRFSGNYSESEDATSAFVALREVNLFGLAKQLGIGADYSSFNDRGWRYTGSYFNANIFGTHIYIGSDVGFSAPERFGSFAVGRPFFSDRTRYGFSSAVSYYNGEEVFDFKRPDGEALSLQGDLRRTVASGWYSSSRGTPGNVFRASVSSIYNRTIRDGLPDIHRALENSISVFGGISSQGRRYTRFVNADFNGVRQVAIGAAGSVSIGKVVPHNGGLDNLVYIGGDASQAVRHGDFYGFASVEGGTGLAKKEARFTTERVVASAAYQLDVGTVAARFEQSNVWNWPRYLFVPLDNLNGLRGHPRLDHFGHNRMVFNLEYRLYPVLRFWLFDFGATAFYDVGSVWDQAEKLSQAQFHSSAGLGVRVGNVSSEIDKGLLRVDVAYNFDQKRIARLIISTQEAFDVFGTLEYRPPAPYLY